tara:strand:+ start:634 stop:2703 length:2070 start_codon:yes stop_codon:yes gene_type:complete
MIEDNILKELIQYLDANENKMMPKESNLYKVFTKKTQEIRDKLYPGNRFNVPIFLERITKRKIIVPEKHRRQYLSDRDRGAVNKRIEKGREHDKKRAKDIVPCPYFEKYKIKTKYCKGAYARKYIKKHMREQHPDHCEEFNIPPRQPKKTQPIGFTFIKKMVDTDSRKDHRQFQTLLLDSEKQDKIVFEIIERMKRNKQYDESIKNQPCYDDYGGYLPTGFDLHSHSLYKLSLNRLDNDKPHFIWKDDSWLSNIEFIILGMNTSWYCPEVSIDRIRVLLQTPIDIQLQNQRLTSLNDSVTKNSIPYNSIKNVRDRHKKINGRNGVKNRPPDPCNEEWPDMAKQYDHAKTLLYNQLGLCCLSGLLMVFENKTNTNQPFAACFDAIDTRKGHITNNIRWQARFLNCTNMDKTKTEKYEDDSVTAWTPELFKLYIWGTCPIPNCVPVLPLPKVGKVYSPTKKRPLNNEIAIVDAKTFSYYNVIHSNADGTNNSISNLKLSSSMDHVVVGASIRGKQVDRVCLEHIKTKKKTIHNSLVHAQRDLGLPKTAAGNLRTVINGTSRARYGYYVTKMADEDWSTYKNPERAAKRLGLQRNTVSKVLRKESKYAGNSKTLERFVFEHLKKPAYSDDDEEWKMVPQQYFESNMTGIAVSDKGRVRVNGLVLVGIERDDGNMYFQNTLVCRMVYATFTFQ